VSRPIAKAILFRAPERKAESGEKEEKSGPFKGPERKVGSRGLILGENFLLFFQNMNNRLP
jgi:hypothetical protein